MSLTADEFSSLFPQVTQYTERNEVNTFLEMLDISNIPAGTIILHDNTENDCLYFVMEGTLDCYIEKDGKRVSIGKVHPGEYVGEISMLEGGAATSSVITETPVKLYTLTRTAFRQLEKQYPVISGKLLRSISSMLISRLMKADQLLFDGMATPPPSSSSDSANHNIRKWFVDIYHQLHH